MTKKGLGLGVVLTMVGCTSFRSVQPERFIPEHKPSSVMVWTIRDDVTVVSYPHIRGDSLTGVVLDDPWAIPLKDVARVRAATPDVGKTALLVVGAAASTVGVYLLASSGHGAGVIPCPYYLAYCPRTGLPAQ